MHLSATSRNLWQPANGNEIFPQFRAARDYLEFQEFSGTSSTVLRRHFSPPSFIPTEDSHRSDAFLRFREGSLAHFPKRYYSEGRNSRVGGKFHEWQARSSDLFGSPAVAASNFWECLSSDSSSSFSCSPHLYSSGGGILSRWLAPTIPSVDGPHSPSTDLIKSPFLGEYDGGIASSSAEKEGFCLSNVSDSIDRSIEDSLQRLCDHTPLLRELASPAYNLEDSTNDGNFIEGPSNPATEGWAAATAAAAFAAASLRHSRALRLGTPDADTKADLGAGVKLEPEDIDAFLRAKSKTDEAAARIRQKVAASRKGRVALRCSPRVSNKKLTGAPTVTASHRHSKPSAHSNFLENAGIAKRSDKKIGSTSNRMSRNKRTNAMPNIRCRHSRKQGKVERMPDGPIPTANLIALGMRMQPQWPRPHDTQEKPGSGSSHVGASELPSGTFAGVTARTQPSCDSFHLREGKAVATLPVSGPDEAPVASFKPSLKRSLPVAAETTYVKPLMQPFTGDGTSRAPVELKHSFRDSTPQSDILKTFKHSNAYCSSAPISPLLSVARGKETGMADNKSSGRLAAPTPTPSTTITESPTLNVEPPHAYAPHGADEQIVKDQTQKKPPACKSHPAPKACTVVSGEMQLTTASSKPAEADLHPAALRHLARVICKALTKAVGRESRNSALAFLRKWYGLRCPGLSLAHSTVARRRETETTSQSSRTAEACKCSHESVAAAYQQNDHCSSPFTLGGENRMVMDSDLEQSNKSTHHEIKCTNRNLTCCKGCSWEALLPLLDWPNKNPAASIATPCEMGLQSNCVPTSPSCHSEHQGNNELPQGSNGQEKELGITATSVLEALDSFPKDPNPTDCSGVSPVPTAVNEALAAANGTTADAPAVLSEKVKLQQLPATVPETRLQILGSTNKKFTDTAEHPGNNLVPVSPGCKKMDQPTKLHTQEPCCYCTTCKTVQKDSFQHSGWDSKRPREQDNPKREPYQTFYLHETNLRKHEDVRANTSETRARKCNTAISCPATPHCTPRLQRELGSSEIERYYSYHRLKTLGNQKPSAHPTAILARTTSPHEFQGAHGILLSSPVVSSKGVADVSKLVQEHHHQASTACQPRLPQYELLELANSGGQSLPVVGQPAASLIQNAARACHQEQVIEGGIKGSTPSAIVSPGKVALVDSVESLKSAFRQQEDLALAETASLAKVNRSLQDKLEQLREQLNAQRHALEYIRKPSDSSRTLLKTCSIEELGSPSEDPPARPNCRSQAEQQEMQGEESAPAIPVTTKDSPNEEAREPQGDETSEYRSEELACGHDLGLTNRLVQHISGDQAAEQGRAATVSPRKTADNLKHQQLQCQPGPTGDAVCQLLWELLDRMNYFKLRLAPAQQLETVHAAGTHNRHRPQHLKEFGDWAGARILKNHRTDHARSLQPAASKRDWGMRLSVVGKSMGNTTKARPNNWLFNAAENTPQHILPFPALQQIPSGRVQRIRQLGAPPLETKQQRDSPPRTVAHEAVPVTTRNGMGSSNNLERGEMEDLKPSTRAPGQIPNDNDENVPAVKTSLYILGRRLSHAPLTLKMHLNTSCSRPRCLKMKKPALSCTREPADNCRYPSQPPSPSGSARENGIIDNKQEARADLPCLFDDPVQLHNPGQHRRECIDEGSELLPKISELKSADPTRVTERATAASFSSPFCWGSSKKNVGLRGDSSNPKEEFLTSSITKRSCTLVAHRGKQAQDKYDKPSRALEQTPFQQVAVSWDAPTELQKKVLDFQQVGAAATPRARPALRCTNVSSWDANASESHGCARKRRGRLTKLTTM